MRHPAASLLTSLVLAAAALTGVLAQRAPGEPPDPRLVQPEALKQGFIVVVTDKTGLAGKDSPVYLASNRSGWDPGKAEWKLTQRSDGKWQISVPPNPEGLRMQFKFTRGDWDHVEVAADLSDIDNRTFKPIDVSGLKPGARPVIEFTVEGWHDQRPDSKAGAVTGRYHTIEATGTVKRLEVQGGGVAIMRDLLVWLPPDYDDPANAARRYSVLYLQDGQNVFEKQAGVPGEWGADETATDLIEHGKMEPIIIVAIPNAGPMRISEYSPVQLIQSRHPHAPTEPEIPTDLIRPRADGYVEFLLHEVMPRVERAFRVQTGPEHTAIGGSSLGAIVSLYAATRHPDVFGEVLAESPTLLPNDELMFHFFEHADTWPARVYIGVSRQESGESPDLAERNAMHVTVARRFADLLKSKGVSASDIKLAVGDGTHNEKAWAERLPAALEFLFPPRPN